MCSLLHACQRDIGRLMVLASGGRPGWGGVHYWCAAVFGVLLPVDCCRMAALQPKGQGCIPKAVLFGLCHSTRRLTSQELHEGLCKVRSCLGHFCPMARIALRAHGREVKASYSPTTQGLVFP